MDGSRQTQASELGLAHSSLQRAITDHNGLPRQYFSGHQHVGSHTPEPALSLPLDQPAAADRGSGGQRVGDITISDDHEMVHNHRQNHPQLVCDLTIESAAAITKRFDLRRSLLGLRRLAKVR